MDAAARFRRMIRRAHAFEIARRRAPEPELAAPALCLVAYIM
jgi:hypothetical protein